MSYSKLIAKHLEAEGVADRYEARHIEAWMRSECGTLDSLSPGRFRNEVLCAIACIKEVGVEQAEALATSFGL